MSTRLKRSIHTFLELSAPGDFLGRIFDYFMISLIVANAVAVILESVEEYEIAYGAAFQAFDTFSVIIFTVEYVFRLWSCTASHAKQFQHPVWGRLRFATTPLLLIDLLAILPFYLSAFLNLDLRILRVFRLLRLLKITRYSPALAIIGSVLRQQFRPLAGTLMILLTTLVLLASLVYVAEHDAQPTKFGNIPAAMWWTIVTLTTVGYGDIIPVTVLGRLVGGITMITGVMMVALPTGIVVSGFANEIRKRDFVINWKLVSNVPLFSSLDAAQVAEIVSLLTPMVVPANHAVVRVGEPADSMYFVVSGRLEIELPPEPIWIEEGDFFGEMAIIESRRCGASVVALTECNLLELKADDFRKLRAEHPSIQEAMTRVADIRRSQNKDQSGKERV